MNTSCMADTFYFKNAVSYASKTLVKSTDTWPNKLECYARNA
jgi:hypothetical protein